ARALPQRLENRFPVRVLHVTPQATEPLVKRDLVASGRTRVGFPIARRKRNEAENRCDGHKRKQEEDNDQNRYAEHGLRVYVVGFVTALDDLWRRRPKRRVIIGRLRARNRASAVHGGAPPAARTLGYPGTAAAASTDR